MVRAKVNYIFIFVLFLQSFCLLKISAQQNGEYISGKVSYLSSQNVYMKFETTENISAGDSVFVLLKNSYKPVAVVKFISSRSIAAEIISDYKFRKGLNVFIKNSNSKIVETEITKSNRPEIIESINTNIKSNQNSGTINPAIIKGRLAASSYTTLSNQSRNDYQRWKYLFSLHGENFTTSNISFDSYMVFRYRTNEWTDVKNNIGRALKIYSLSIDVPVTAKSKISIGRKRNNSISNLGAIDGVQYELALKNNSIGLVIGSRPNLSDYGYNSKMFEYGIYFLKSDSLVNGTMKNSIAVFNQTNNFKTDRRFIYLQHNSNVIKNINLFISTEVDLYKRENGIDKNKLSLTSIYLSTRFAVSRKLRFNISYDARKNVVYYETYKHIADSILQSELRQGFRIRLNYKPFRNLSLSLSSGYRFKKGDSKPSRNINSGLTYSNIPIIKAAVTVNGTFLGSNYVDGKIFRLRLSKNILNGEVYTSLSYRKVLYDYLNSSTRIDQNIISCDVSTRIIDKLYFSISYEGIFEKKTTYGMLFINLSQRF